ncbi:MAG: N-6 DNA methylase [Candidatus ainarchaeum sp.]|nr:N-6 DNA methylase [Candidatus ainarchaeum sp.]
MLNKTKNLGQIYTPAHIVNDILNLVDYSGEKILQKHIIDNSCGNGAFLQEIIEKYISAYKVQHGSLLGVESELSKYIHGIEIDKEEFIKCRDNLDKLIFWQGLTDVDWDIKNADTLTVKDYDLKMDYVVGNPPYVRIHNLQDNFYKIRDYNFCKNGMVDLFIVFYEIGFKMLNSNGKLCYITPNSFYSSEAGKHFREFIINSKHLYHVIDLGHYQPFKATTYTTICAFDNAQTFDNINYSIYTKDGKIQFEEELKVIEAFNNGKMILAKKREQEFLKDIVNYIPQNKNLLQVKNGFATLSDPIFIKDSFEFSNTIDILKASTGAWKKCVFPYDKQSKALPFENLNGECKKYLLQNKIKLMDRSIDKGSDWYVFGRSQAISDVYKNKIAINTTIKNIKSIKINFVKKGQGIYSGLYILTDFSIKTIENIIKTQDFIDYVSTLGKCKSGGYFAFSSKDLKQYLIYKLEGLNE